MDQQSQKTMEEILSIVNQISFMDRSFFIGKKDDGFFLQVRYMEEDIETGKMERQQARKWYVSPFSTETEIVETAFKACKISMEHVVKEHFQYKGRRVYSPHFDIAARIELCDAKRFDGRIPKMKSEDFG